MFHPNNTTSIQYRHGAAIKDASFRACSFLNGLGHGPVYEVLAGPPSWTSLYRHVAEYVAQMADKAIVDAIKSLGRSTPECERRLSDLKSHLASELPTDVARDVLDVALERDRLRCHHNPTDCLALELWRVFFPLNGKSPQADVAPAGARRRRTQHLTEVSVVHHEFAFPKTTNYPDIVQNLERLFELVGGGGGGDGCDDSSKLPNSEDKTVTSFRLELKNCEVGCFVQDKVIDCVGRLGENLRVLEIPGLGSDELLSVAARRCPYLEVINLKGSREQVTDVGCIAYVDKLKDKTRLLKLDVTRCMLSHQVLPSLQKLSRLRDLNISTRVLDEVGGLLMCDGMGTNGSTDDIGASKPTELPSVTAVTVEHDNVVQVSVNQVLAHLKQMFPNALHVSLRNCIACELHVTLTQHPSNISYMRQYIHTLELMSADYFNFPRLVYPCPNLEMLHIEKPTNDIFNTEASQPFMQNEVPFENLKVLRLSRISLTNLTQFLSKSQGLKTFKVTNIGRRERPRWTDCRIMQILPPGSVPRLEEFHVSCLPNEGLSTVENHRFLHLTSETVKYLTENFLHLRRIAGIETWTPRNCDRESLNLVLASRPDSAGKFHLTM